MTRRSPSILRAIAAAAAAAPLAALVKRPNDQRLQRRMQELGIAP